MEAAARTAARVDDEPGKRPMTWHGAFQLQAAGAAPPATVPRGPVVSVAADRAMSGCTPSLQSRAQTSRSGPLASIAALPGRGHAIADISRKSKSP